MWILFFDVKQKHNFLKKDGILCQSRNSLQVTRMAVKKEAEFLSVVIKRRECPCRPVFLNMFFKLIFREKGKQRER